MNKLLYLLILVVIQSCICQKKKNKEPIPIVAKKYSFTLYDSSVYYNIKSDPKYLRLGGSRCSDCDFIIRTDSIVIRYIRSGKEILDTIKNPFE